MSNTVTLCAMMKNEARYISEWVAYHRALGVDDIFIINNESTDGTAALLETLERAGVCRTMSWKTIKTGHNQNNAYLAAVRTFRTEWAFFLDVDEFFVPKQHEDITSYLDMFSDDVSLISLNWRLFGSSGQQRYMPAPTFLRFLHASTPASDVNKHLKYFARISDLKEPYVHSALMKQGKSVNNEGQPITISGFAWGPISQKCAQVNHYVLRSREEYDAKIERGRLGLAHTENPKLAPERREGFFRFHDQNDEFEDTILRFYARYKAERDTIDAIVAPIQKAA